jgi:hypothetical protein
MMGRAAKDLQAFYASMPELSDEVLGGLVASNPGLVSSPLDEASGLAVLATSYLLILSSLQVRAQMEQIASALDLSIPAAARFIAKVPAAWQRAPDGLVQKLQPLASALDVPLPAVVGLLTSQPTLWNINHPSIIKDR